MSDYRAAVANQLGAISLAQARSSAALRPPTSAEEFMGIPFRPGQRVFDTLTASDGTVVSGTVLHAVAPAAPTDAAAGPAPFFQLPTRIDSVVITVQLADGSTVQRAPKDLIALPAELTVPLAHLEPVR